MNLYQQLKTQRESVTQSWERLNENINRDWDLYGYDFGIHRINMAIGGIVPTRVTTIGARSGSGKCLAAGTLVLYANGDLKPVEQVHIGDVLLGPDGPTRVLSTTFGEDTMYRVHQNKNRHKRGGFCFGYFTSTTEYVSSPLGAVKENFSPFFLPTMA